VVLLLALSLAVILLLRFNRFPASALFPGLWFLTLFLITPFNGTAWRFSFVTLVPLTIMAGAGLVAIADLIVGIGRAWRKPAAAVFVVLAVAAVANGSWGMQTLLLPTSPAAQDTAHFQEAAFSALQWLRQNTPNTSIYYSVTDWRFTFITFDYHRNAMYHFTSNESDAVNMARNYQLSTPNGTQVNGRWVTLPSCNCTFLLSPEYVVVTRYVSESLQQNPSLYPWNTFVANANFTLIYKTSDVEVFHLSPLAACFTTYLAPDEPARVCPTS
jgi:hypothetical protein